MDVMLVIGNEKKKQREIQEKKKLTLGEGTFLLEKRKEICRDTLYGIVPRAGNEKRKSVSHD